MGEEDKQPGCVQGTRKSQLVEAATSSQNSKVEGVTIQCSILQFKEDQSVPKVILTKTGETIREDQVTAQILWFVLGVVKYN